MLYAFLAGTISVSFDLPLKLGHNQATLEECIGTQVLLAPQMDLSDLPLKTFYRYALPAFSEEGQILEM